jgi:multiple sugar transport system permease protein
MSRTSTKQIQAVHWFILWTARVTLLLFLLLPILNAIRVSLSAPGTLGTNLIPQDPYFKSYVVVWDEINLSRQILNSGIYGFTSTVANLIITVPAAYAISRYQFTGRKVFLFLLLMTQMFAAVVILPTLYLVIQALGLLNSYFAVTLTVTAILMAFSVWLLKGFFDSIPVEIEEAAMMDGCSRLQVLRQVVLPMAAPGVLTAGIFVFINGYNQFLIPLVFVSDTSKLPITVGIYNLFGQQLVPYHLVMTASLIGVIPIVLLYLVAQNYIVEGLTSGGAKG